MKSRLGESNNMKLGKYTTTAGVLAALLIAILSLLIGSGIGFYVGRSTKSSKTENDSAQILITPALSFTPVPIPTPIPVNTTGWKTYTSIPLAITLQYPSAYTIDVSTIDVDCTGNEFLKSNCDGKISTDVITLNSTNSNFKMIISNNDPIGIPCSSGPNSTSSFQNVYIKGNPLGFSVNQCKPETSTGIEQYVSQGKYEIPGDSSKWKSAQIQIIAKDTNMVNDFYNILSTIK